LLILGLESSCDDCSAAIVEETNFGPKILSISSRSQDCLHAPYGGVVPELAAREHLLQLRGVCREALSLAGAQPSGLSRVAATQGPGLIGCLLTAFSAAKAIAWHSDVPFVGVHHILGHLNAARFDEPDLEFPALALLVSGGHTHLYLASGWTEMRLLMKTRDDAAGEAFDKTARMLNLGYPGGPIVDKLAQLANNAAPSFTAPKFRDGLPSWSFSGLKTAIRQRIEKSPGLSSAGEDSEDVRSLCKSVNDTIADWLLRPLPSLLRLNGAASLVVSGGVACNSVLRRKAIELGEKCNVKVALPKPALCTDNGAMVAAAGALLPLGSMPGTEKWTGNADAALKLGSEK
jgi:N6-L-threonylcarbamoyladenine synthase